MSTDQRTRAWIEVDGGAVRANLGRIAEAVGSRVALVPMVKANAYGLGVDRAVRALEPASPWGFGVATVDEGRELRDLGVDRPVLVCSPLPPGSYPDALTHGLTPCLSDLGAVQLLARAARASSDPVGFHIEIDTGMGRAGFDWRQASEWGAAVAAAMSPARPTGVFTHFHSADEDDASILVQWRRFEDALAALPWDRSELMVHAANSAAALRRPSVAADAVRPGVFLYGGSAGRGLPEPEPVMQLRARVLFVREAPPGATLGYGATHVARGWERWATLGIGYGDGLPRSLGNRGSALVRGRRVPIVGRISMDMTVVDITDVTGVEPGDVATLVGRDGEAAIPLGEVADLADTIDYEILTGLTGRLPRIWMDDGRNA